MMSLSVIVLAAAALQPAASISLCGLEAASIPAFFLTLDEAEKTRTMSRMDEDNLHIYNLDERSAPMPRTRVWMATSVKHKAYPAIACYDYYYDADGLEMKTDFRCDGDVAACEAFAERLRVKKDPS